MRVQVRLSHELHTHSHVAAAEIFYGGLGDDGWADFRASVVLAGPTIYESFLADADSFAENYPGFHFLVAGDVIHAVYVLYREKTGREMWDDSPDDTVHVGGAAHGDDPIPYEDDVLEKLFPRTWRATLAYRSA